MTIQLTLPEDLEILVKQEVESGMYDSESDVVCRVLRLYFHPLSEGEILDTLILPRLEALQNGTLETFPWSNEEAIRWEQEEIEKIEAEQNKE